jgi:hypothetical protein
VAQRAIASTGVDALELGVNAEKAPPLESAVADRAIGRRSRIRIERVSNAEDVMNNGQ